MANLLTADQMRALEATQIETGNVTGLELMERAGRGVIEAVFEEWPELAQAPKRALVLCGPGNNGGDGFVIARLLLARGWHVEVFLFGAPEKLPPDARCNYERWRALGKVRPFEDGPVIEEGAIVFDVLFGIGQTRPLPSAVESFAAHATLVCGLGQARLVAVDIPSGVDSDTGLLLGDTQIFADLTVTFHSKKYAHCHAEGAQRCGAVRVVSIGLPEGPTP